MSISEFFTDQSFLDTIQSDPLSLENLGNYSFLDGKSESNATSALSIAPSLDNETPSSASNVSLSPESPNDFMFQQHEKRKVGIVSGEAQDSPHKSIKSNSNGSVSNTSKKPGRKPDTSEPANKRKAQNRAAQRAFRERKERHLKDLEDRVSELEQETETTNTENEILKIQVSQLQAELKKYRKGPLAASNPKAGNLASASPTDVKPFTFEFPFFGGAKVKSNSNESRRFSNESESSSNLNNVNKNNSANPSPIDHPSIGSSSSLYSSTSLPGSRTSASSASSSPFSSKDKFSVTPSPRSNFTSPPKDLVPENDEEDFCANLSLACGTKENPVPVSGSVTSPLLLSSNVKKSQNEPNISSTSHSSSSSGLPLGRMSSVSLFSPPPFDADFLEEYRDPIFDSQDFSLPDLTTESSTFDPLENFDYDFTNIAPGVSKDMGKVTTQQKLKQSRSSNDEEESVPDNTGNLMTCTAVWDRISAHPKFGDLDIDGLCAELRMKAKCSDTGVVLSENDVDHVLSSLS